MRRNFLLAALLAASAAQAQLVPPDPEWQEHAPPPPPPLRTHGLIPLDMPGSSLRWGVDPASVSVGSDQVVRYVVVASGPQTVTGLYEGLRCQTGEVKVYMRHNGSEWQPATGGEWKPLRDMAATRHSMQIARGGACMGRSAGLSPDHVVRALRAPQDGRDSPRQ